MLLFPLMLVFAFQAHLESVVLHDAVSAELENVRAGSRVQVVDSRVPNTEPLVDASRCARLEYLPHVKTAAGLTTVGTIEVASAPGSPLLRLRGTPSAPTMLDPDLVPSEPGGFFIAQAASESQGVVSPGTFRSFRSGSTSSTPTSVDTYDPSDRLSTGAITVLSVEPLSKVAECWFELDPGADQQAAAGVALAALNTETLSFAVRPLLLVDPSPAEIYESRVTRHLWSLVACFVALLGSLVALADRRESALYRSLGAGRLGVMAIGGIEWLLASWWAAALGVFTWLLWAPTLTPEATAQAIWSVAASVNVGAATALVTRGLLATGNIFDQLKDRA